MNKTIPILGIAVIVVVSFMIIVYYEPETEIESFDEHTVYSFPFGMTQEEIENQIHADPIYVENPNDTDELILDIDSMIHVQKILDKCNYIQKLESGEIPWENPDGSFNVIRGDLPFFNNGTHYIDSDICKWINSLEAITYICFEANPIEQNWYSGPGYFYNDTHHLDVQNCEWTVFSEEYLELPLCDPNPEYDLGKCRKFS